MTLYTTDQVYEIIYFLRMYTALSDLLLELTQEISIIQHFLLLV